MRILSCLGLVAVAGACGRLGFGPIQAPDDAPIAPGCESGASCILDDAGTSAIIIDTGSPVTDAADGVDTMNVLVTTQGPGRLLVAAVAWGSANNAHGPIAVTGGGLAWTRAFSQTFTSGMYVDWDMVEVWTAPAPTQLNNAPITATATTGVQSGGSGAFAVWAVTGHAGSAVRSTGVTRNNSAGSPTGPVAVLVSQTVSGSLVIGGACKDQDPGTLTARPDNVLVQFGWDSSTSVRCYIWQLAASSPGGDVTIGSTGSTNRLWIAAAAEIAPE